MEREAEGAVEQCVREGSLSTRWQRDLIKKNLRRSIEEPRCAKVGPHCRRPESLRTGRYSNVVYVSRAYKRTLSGVYSMSLSVWRV